jgi:hypothetical protein
MDLTILRRIEELKERLSDLRSRGCDTTCIIGIEAIEQELARTAARLPREWDVVLNREIEDSISEDVRADSRWSL